jgi:hypothetical protein
VQRGRTQCHRPVPGNHRPRLSGWRTGRAALPAPPEGFVAASGSCGWWRR